MGAKNILRLLEGAGVSDVTATTGGGTDGLIPGDATFVTVTSDSVNKQISLPAGFVGQVIMIYVPSTTFGCELISASAGAKVNTVLVGATNEAALTAGNTYNCTLVAADTWIVRGFTAAGADQGALVPDAL